MSFKNYKIVFLLFTILLTSFSSISARDETKVSFSKDGTWLNSYPTSWDQEEYTIPEGVLYINKRAFTGTKVKRVVLPKSLIDIKREAFYDSQATAITIPGVAFKEGCARLSGKNIGQRAFYNTGFSEVIIPDGISTLGEEAFGRMNLDIIQGIPFDKIDDIISKSVFTETSFNIFVLPPDFDFSHTEDLLNFKFNEISFSSSPTTCVVTNRMCLSPDRKKLLYLFPTQFDKEIEIPSTVETICAFAFGSRDFSGNRGYIKLGKNVKAIEPYAFTYCNAVALKIMNPNIEIGKEAFFRAKISYIDMSETAIAELPDETFLGANATSLILPQTLKKCGEKCFEGWIKNPGEEYAIPKTSYGNIKNVYAPSPEAVTGLCSYGHDSRHATILYPLVNIFNVPEDLYDYYIRYISIIDGWMSWYTEYAILEDQLVPFALNYGSPEGIGNNTISVKPGMEYTFYGDCFRVGNVIPVSERWSVHPYNSDDEEAPYDYASIDEGGTLSVNKSIPTDIDNLKFVCRYSVTDQYDKVYSKGIVCRIADTSGVESINTDSDMVASSYTLPHGVFDLQGRYCGPTVEGLAKGLYIVSDSRGVRKVTVR